MTINFEKESYKGLEKIGQLKRELKEVYGPDIHFDLLIGVRKGKERIGHIKMLPAPDYAIFEEDL